MLGRLNNSEAATEGVGAVPAAGLILGEPPPEPHPLNYAAGPSRLPDVAPAMAQPPIAPPPPVQGGNIDALGAQARRIGRAGADGLEAASEATGRLADAAEIRKGAIDEQARIGAQKAQAREQGLDEQIGQYQAYQQRLDEVRRGEEEAVGAAKKERDEAVQDARYAGLSRDRRLELQAIVSNKDATLQQKAQAKQELEQAQDIDPDRFWRNADTGTKVTAIIAQIIGGAAAGFSASLGGDGTNHAMQTLRQIVENDIGAQRGRFAKKEREADAAGARVEATEADFERDRAQALRDYSVGLELVKMKVDKLTAGLEGTEQHASAQMLKAGIDEDLVKNDIAITQHAQNAHLNALVSQGSLMSTQAQMQEGRALRAVEQQATGNDAASLEANMQARGLAVKPGARLSNEEIKKASDIKGKSDALILATQRLVDLRDELWESPQKWADPSFRKKSEAALRQAQAAWKEGKGLGAWDKGTADMLDQVYGGSPSDIGFVRAKYQEVLRGAFDDRNRMLDALGVTPIAQGQQSQNLGVPGERDLGR